MTRISRRKLLGACAGLAAGSALLDPGIARADHYVATGGPTYKVLEIYLKGGLSMGETLWSVDAATDAWSFITPGVTDLEWSALVPGTVPADQVPADFSFDSTWLASIPADGRDLFLGPSAKPLAAASVLDRARVVATSHDLLPHEAAVPFTLMGNRLGRAVSSGLGAVVNHLHSGVIDVPSVVFHKNADAFLHHALATGQFGAEHTPLAVRVGQDVSFDRGALEASGFSREDGDPLRGLYVSRYENLLTHGVDRTRSRAFDAYDGSNLHLGNWAAIDSLLAPLDLVVGASPDRVDNHTVKAIHAASSLLTGTSVEYALVFDQGLTNDYDSHNVTASELVHAERQAVSFWSVCHALAEAVLAGTLDLDTTMVVINSEFGRKDKDGGTGTEHSFRGYATMFLGGPILAATSTVIGNLDDDAVATDDVSAVDVRAAIALALGIDGYTAATVGADPIYDPAESGSAIGGVAANLEATFFA
jgi:Protein of unknown function (DUF1501)